MSFWLLPRGDKIIDPEGNRWVTQPQLRLPSLGNHAQQHEIKALLKSAYPEESPEWIEKELTSLWMYYNDLLPEDVVLVPDSDGTTIHCLEINGPYRFLESIGHAFPASEIKALALHDLVFLKPFLSQKSWCVALSDASISTQLQIKLNMRRGRVRRYFPWLLSGLLLLNLFMIALSYWRDATGHFTP